MTRTSQFKPRLFGLAITLFVFALFLIYMGGFTTTIKAGMVFLDWPLSNGSINPDGWLSNEAMRAEHSHRLLGMIVGFLAIGLVAWTWRVEARRWLRWLSLAALVLIVLQGLLGGMRVLHNNIDLALIHGVCAQLILCVLAAIVVAQSPVWFRSLESQADAPLQGLRRGGIALLVLIVAQLIIAATVRFRDAGLAIPTFPLTPDGSLIPQDWNFAVAIHFTHRAVAAAIFFAYLPWVFRIFQNPGVTRGGRRLAATGFAFLCIQILLGASVIWTGREAVPTTLHVINGALVLASTWAATFLLFAPKIDAATQARMKPASEKKHAVGQPPLPLDAPQH